MPIGRPEREDVARVLVAFLPQEFAAKVSEVMRNRYPRQGTRRQGIDAFHRG
jgi:hypothetical protein